MMQLDQKNEVFIEHNINPVVLELFYEYVICLTNYIFATYLGDKYYNHYNARDKNSKLEDHFMYCSFKVDEHFEKLGYKVINDPAIANHFYNFFEDNFYEADKNNLQKLKQIIINKLSFIHIQGGLSDAKLELLKSMYGYFLKSFRNPNHSKN